MCAASRGEGWIGGGARACSRRRRSPAPAEPAPRSGTSRLCRTYRQGPCRRPAARWPSDSSGQQPGAAHDAQVADEVRDEQEDVLARPHIRQRAEAHPATAGAAASVRENRLCRAACADPCNTRHAPPPQNSEPKAGCITVMSLCLGWVLSMTGRTLNEGVGRYGPGQPGRLLAG